MKKLALLGGAPILKPRQSFPFPQTTDQDAQEVLNCFTNESFSAFRAGDYEGGHYVKKFEQSIASTFNSDYAVSFDTWSNGIVASLVSLGIGPGDEVLIAPYTMTSCATSIMACGAIPVFCDVDLNTGCICPNSIEEKITSKTKAIFVVHLFGFPANMPKITEIAERFGVYIFEDCAQAPVAEINGRLCGTMGDVGGFSFTESKFVMGGEGGISITNNKKINNGLRLIRNHGEVCSTVKGNKSAAPEEYNYTEDVLGDYGILGFNFRMTELSAALIYSQWKTVRDNVAFRRLNVSKFFRKIEEITYIKPMNTTYPTLPSWYSVPLRFIGQEIGISRDRFVAAINAEGFNFSCGYCPPLYRQKLYHSKKHWSIKDISYENVKCANIERLHDHELFMTLDIRPPYSEDYFDKMAQAFIKAHENINELK